MQSQGAQTQSQSIVKSGLKRPNWINRNCKQNVVLVRDKSPSMQGRKARDASDASQDLVRELAKPENKDGFNVAVVDFSGSSSIVHPLMRATELDGRMKPLRVGFFSNGTNITAGLKDVLRILKENEEPPSGIMYLRPVGICFSDGCHNTGPHPSETATRVKEIADLVTVAFGDDADEGLLQNLATTPQHFYRCSNGRELRKFLAAVGATMSQTMASGTDATKALSTIHQ